MSVRVKKVREIFPEERIEVPSEDSGDATSEIGGSRAQQKTSFASLMGLADVELEEKPRAFGFGSLFDYEVVSAKRLPFELPVSQYLEETLFGMHGAPSEDGNNLDSVQEERTRWIQMKKLFSTPVTQELVTALFWVCIMSLFFEIRSSEEEVALQDLRRSLAESWLALSRGLGPQQLPASLDEALTLFSVAATQVIFRLIIDAFPDDRDSLVRHHKRWFHKLSEKIHQEFWGLQPGRACSHILRSKLFIESVVSHPHINQLESMKSALRREKAAMTRQDPLVFGTDSAEPLDDVQLLHIMNWRDSQRAKAFAARPISHHSSSDRKSTLKLDGGVEDPVWSFLPVGAEELNGDRYNYLEKEAQDLVLQQSRRLFPDQGDEVVHVTDSGQESPRRRHRKASAFAELGVDPQELILHRDSPTDGPRSVSIRRQQQRRSRAAERRRRDDRLEELLDESLPASPEMNTVFVSPLISRLAPSSDGRNLLNKPFGECRTVHRQPPQAGGSLHWDTLEWNQRHAENRRVAKLKQEKEAASGLQSAHSSMRQTSDKRLSVLKPKKAGDSANSCEASEVMPTLTQVTVGKIASSGGRSASKSSPLDAGSSPKMKSIARKRLGFLSRELHAAGRAAVLIAVARRSASDFRADEATKEGHRLHRARQEGPNSEKLPVERERVSSQVVMDRLRHQAETLKGMSFDEYKRSHDMVNGQNHEKTDPDKLAMEELAYVSKVKGLVGARNHRAPTLLHPRAYDTKARRAPPKDLAAVTSTTSSCKPSSGSTLREAKAALAATQSSPDIRVSSSLTMAGSVSLGFL